MEMTRRWGKDQTGIEYDPDAARALFRKSAEQSYLPARAALWKMVGGSAQELLYILPDEPTEDAAAALRAAQVNYIRPAFDACHDDLQAYGLALWGIGVERQAMLHPDDADYLRSDWAETKAMLGALYREHCETD